MNGVGYFSTPQLVEELWNEGKQVKIVSVFAKGNYSYVLEQPEGSKTNQLYSWGMGENYVLGSRDDDNQFKPYTVHPKMFEELPVLMVGAGTQHVVVLTADSQERGNALPQFTEDVLNFKLPPPEPKTPKVVPKKVRAAKLEQQKQASQEDHVMEEDQVHQAGEEEEKKLEEEPIKEEAPV